MKIKLASLLLFLIVATTGLLRAQDARPVVDAATVPVEKIANGALPTFHIVGDSTVKSGGTGAGLWGWGERITPFFDTKKINVVNHAIGGRSARTFFTEGRWQKVLDALKPGDFVIIQFGHNDQGRIGDPAMKGRPDGKGIGDETVEDTSYEVQTSPDPMTPTSWAPNQIAPKSSCSIGNQTIGAKLWARVRGHGKDSPGLWSDPAAIIVT